MVFERLTVRIVWLASLTLFILGRVESRGNGAPDTACDSMTPGHYGSTSQTTPFNYQVTAGDTVYSPGKELEMTLSGSSGESIAGYLVQVRKSDGTTIGSFVTDASYDGKTACSGKAWTHHSAYAKSNVTFKWKAPQTLEGNLDVFATVAKAKLEYWVKQNMKTLTLDPTATAGPTESTTTPPTTTPGKQGTIAYPSECGKTLICYSDCKTDSCGYLATMKPGTDSIDFTLAAKVSSSNRWIALGLSSDNDMGEDSVMECVYENGNGDVRQSYNPGKSNQVLSNPSIGLSNIRVSYADNILSCSFTRQKKVDGDAKVFDLNKSWYILFGQGAYSGGQKSRHESNPARTSSQVDFSKPMEIGIEKESHLLYKLHGTFMLFSWVCAASIGIVCATYFKKVWPDTKIGGLHIWFQIHRFCMVLVFLCTIAGFVIIFVEEEGEYSIIIGPTIKEFHPVFGIITTCLCIINPFMAIFRPKPDHSRRWIFNFAHWLVGVGAHSLGIVAAFGGVQMDDVELPNYTVYIMYGFLGWYLFVIVCCELLTRCCTQKKASAAYEMNEVGKSSMHSHESKVSTANGVLNAIFGIHILIVFGFAVAIIVLMFVEK